MRYNAIEKARFLSRPNRFIAHVDLDGRTEVCHVKNTGRCRELLLPGAAVYLERSPNPARKTKYDLIAVEKGTLLINMDAQAPNKVFGEWAAAGKFLPGLTLIRPEYTWEDSRFDFLLEDGQGKIFVEVKGVTLEEDGEVRFPDAPTERGVKHLHGLRRAVAQGHRAAVFFVIQMKGPARFRPNDKTHPAFGEALREAAGNGVGVYAYDCLVTPDTLELDAPVEVDLTPWGER
ncbi:MAG: DNA/RNA nuclease SfsA [Oscillospiraceae bacterium]|nr:DNA/RNA nuclease SfsA [Oscillospiraceae bacterium]